jgi:hypothetical protein
MSEKASSSDKKTKKSATGKKVAASSKVRAEKTADTNKKKEEKKGTKKVKRLCKWKKERYVDKFDELCSMVVPVQYVCSKCGRAASDEKFLCKPRKISS